MLTIEGLIAVLSLCITCFGMGLTFGIIIGRNTKK